ncbi:MAG TPA: hypothetical protein VM737_11260 [Gemmatimonadota bacterium]|nr:hypothetical protein [Gemmatimonadota bacterium]
MSVPRSLSFALVCALVLAACSGAGPAGPDAGRLLAESAAPAYAPPILVQLTAFDSATFLVTGTDGFGAPVAATFGAGTFFRAARIDRYAPTDPCRDLAIAYNTSFSVGSDTGVFAAIGSLATAGCHARIQVDPQTSAVRVFFPTDPLFPNDPIIPNDPV